MGNDTVKWFKVFQVIIWLQVTYRIEFGIEKCANNEKHETIHEGKNGTTKQGKNQNAQSKGHLQIVGNIGNGQHQTSGDERKIKNKYLET